MPEEEVMPQPGWYADPGGTPGRLRFWDGARWTTDTVDRPATGSHEPAPPPHRPDPGPPRRSPWLTFGPILVILGVLVAINAVFTGLPVAPPAPAPATSPPASAPAAGERTLPADAPHPSGGPTLPECPPPTASTLTDGVLSVPVPAGWEVAEGTDDPWQCQAVAYRRVTDDWITSVTVGAAPANGATPAEYARALWDWNLATGYGNGTAVTRVTVGNAEPVTVGGLSGVRLTGTVTVSGLGDVAGDTVQILVLAKGDRLSSVLTVHTTNDPAAPGEMKTIWDGVQVKS